VSRKSKHASIDPSSADKKAQLCAAFGQDRLAFGLDRFMSSTSKAMCQ
jgi:hypothetical protein